MTLSLPHGPARAMWTLPDATSSPTPLVLYLPGLGEPASAGARWRHAWAASGVAVLSLQALQADADAFRSDLARGGEFNALGRQRYGAAAMHERVLAVQAAMSEVQRRAAAGGQPFASIDTSRVVVAGFDLGAYTAMVLAGERMPGGAIPAPAPRVAAVLAISPYADLTAGGLASRYVDIRVPVLSITSADDRDPLGLVASPTQRQAPHAGIQAADKWLLWLYGLSHQQLAGGDLASQASPVAPRGASDGPPGETAGRSRRARGGWGPRAEDARGLEAPAVDPVIAAIGVEQVSVAFLDVVARGDDIARGWLVERAGPWLHGVGELRR